MGRWDGLGGPLGIETLLLMIQQLKLSLLGWLGRPVRD